MNTKSIDRCRTIGKLCAVIVLLVAATFAGTGCAVAPASGGYYAAASYPDYSPYYGYYGYNGSPFQDPGYFGGGIVLSSGRHYSGGYGYHHFGHDFRGSNSRGSGFHHGSGSFHGGTHSGGHTGGHR